MYIISAILSIIEHNYGNGTVRLFFFQVARAETQVGATLVM